VEQANVPGAWEAVAAARFKSPQVPPRSDFGKPDETRYEDIAVPVLIIAGAEDRLREPGYAQELADRIPDCVAHIYENCGHMPSLEMPDRAARDVIDFLAGLEGREPALTASSKED
jgi:pimeloyl-ACP methyl ester carboxylesterase